MLEKRVVENLTNKINKVQSFISMLPDAPCIPYLIGCPDGDVIGLASVAASSRASVRSSTPFGSRIGSLSGNDMIVPHTDSGAARLYGSGLSSSSSLLGSELSFRGMQMPVTGASQHYFMQPDKSDFILMRTGDASLGMSPVAGFWLSLLSLVCIGLFLKAGFTRKMGISLDVARH